MIFYKKYHEAPDKAGGVIAEGDILYTLRRRKGSVRRAALDLGVRHSELYGYLERANLMWSVKEMRRAKD